MVDRWRVLLHWRSLVNHFTATTLPLDSSTFELVPKEGTVLRSADFKIVGAPVLEEIPVVASSAKAADHLPGRQIRIELEDASSQIQLTWEASLREGANYIRQQVTIHALQKAAALAQIVLVNATVPGATVSGHAKGSPVIAGTWFFGFEHPLSECRVPADHASCWLCARTSLAGRTERDLFVCVWRGSSGAVASRLPEICRARTRSSLPHLPALQLLVRPWIFRSLHRAGRGHRGPEFRRGIDQEARSQARQLPFRRWLGRPCDPLEVQSWLSRWFDESVRDRSQIRRCARHLALPVGRL